MTAVFLPRFPLIRLHAFFVLFESLHSLLDDAYRTFMGETDTRPFRKIKE